MEVVVTRIYNATPRKIWNIWTNPKLILYWWGPKRMLTEVVKMDVRVGGKWRFIQSDSSGSKYIFNGKYKEVVPNSKLVYTFELEKLPGHTLTETINIKKIYGETEVTERTSYKSLKDLDRMLYSGMESGAIETMERLAEIIEKK